MQLVASGLRAPWAVDLAPDGRLFVTERAGRVRIVQLGPGGGLRPDPWASLPASTSSDGEKGLLGIALDPDFTQNGFVYLYYSYGPPNGVDQPGMTAPQRGSRHIFHTEGPRRSRTSSVTRKPCRA